MRGESLGTRFPPTSAVVPLSPVRVYTRVMLIVMPPPPGPRRAGARAGLDRPASPVLREVRLLAGQHLHQGGAPGLRLRDRPPEGRGQLVRLLHPLRVAAEPVGDLRVVARQVARPVALGRRGQVLVGP